MATIHISEAEAARDFAALLAQVRAGTEIVIESGTSAVAVLKPAIEPRGRRLSEISVLARQHEAELGYEPTMDEEFAADMEEIIRSRKPRQSAWD